MNIFIFGASVSYGAWDIEGGWPQRLRNFLDKKVSFKSELDSDLYYVVYVLGINNENSDGMVKRFQRELAARISVDEKDNAIIFDVGKNDSRFVKSKNDFEVNPTQFRRNLERLVKVARRITPKIAFVGLFPVNEKETAPFRYAYPGDLKRGISYKNEYIRKYNGIVEGFCKANSLLFINLYPKFSKLNYIKMLDADGLHPNTKGHAAIFTEVKKKLLINKLIRLK